MPEGSYDTVAGFIIKELGLLPEEGKTYEVNYKNLKLTVLSVDERRIDKVRVEILPSTEDENEKTKKEKNKEDR